MKTANDQAVAGPPRSLRSHLATLATLVLALNVAVLVLFLVGLFAGWIRVALDKGDVAGQLKLHLTFNTSEVADDVQEAVQETQRVAGSLETAAEMETVIGPVQRIDAEQGQVVVVNQEGDPVTVRTTEATKIERDGAPSTLAALQAGDRVELVYNVKAGQKNAVKIQHTQKD